MASGKDDSLQAISVQLTGQNYSYWSYVMKNFLKGKSLWGFVSGLEKKPTNDKHDKYAELLAVWEVNNSKIITWINNSVHQSIGFQLAKYDTAKEIWDHLERLYTQSNFAKQYQLEIDIRALQQNSMTIQEFYSAMTNLWDQLALTESAELRAFGPYIARREEQRLVQFLMALRDEFEGLRGSILHRNPLPSVDSVVNELLAEEMRLKSRVEKSVPDNAVFAAPNRRPDDKKVPRVSKDECSYCKKKGHWKAQCPLLSSRAQQQGSHPRHSSSTPATAAISLNDSGTSPMPDLATLTEQFQKFIASQPHAMSASSSGLNSCHASGTSFPSWILDSGASRHMSHDSDSFVSIKSAPTQSILTADGTPMPVAGLGSVCTPNMSFSDVLHVPDLKLNLASVGQLCDSDFLVAFSRRFCYVQDPHSKKLIGTGRRQGGLYVLDELKVPEVAASSVDLSSFRLSPSSSSFYLWHSRLGHVSGSRLKYLVSTGALGNLKSHDISDCRGCKLAKLSALPFSKSSSVSPLPFDLIHSDVWGPSPVSSKGGSRYYVSFIDDCTRYCWVYLMKRRSEFCKIYQMFRALIKTQHNAVIKCFRCDLGGEYTSTQFLDILASDGTIRQTSCTDTPEQNGVAERKHRHIVETARSLLLSASVPSSFWGEAVLTAVHIINRIPSSITSGLSPFEKLYGHAPDYSSMRVFGCACFVLRPHVERSKLTARSALCVFIGYGDGQKGYRCYDPVSHKLYVSRHVVFLEHIPFFSIPSDTSGTHMSELTRIDPFDSGIVETPNTADVAPQPTDDSNALSPVPTAPQEDASEIEAPPAPPPPRYPRRECKSTQLPDFVYSTYSASFASFLASVHSLSEPSSYKEAILDPRWQQAMDEELSALSKTDTWDLVPLPAGKHAIGSRWVYKIKTKSDGSIERYKARLVAKGFSQEYGMDYEETFAPVSKIVTIRSLIAVASVRQWPLFQMDVKNAFLNGDLHEEVYMTPPPGVPHSSGHVCRLKKALYGLKQAPRAWYDKFSIVISSLGFRSSPHDSALFVRCTSSGRTLVSLYVDDMIITGDDVAGIAELKRHLSREFEMKDLGPLRYFLGIEVATSSRGILLSQSKYIGDILDQARLSDTRTVDTPIETNARYSPRDGTALTDPTLYRTLVGSLVYLTITRPDIAYAVHVVSQFVAAPTTVHWAAVLRILRYLRGTQFQSLLYSSTSSLELRGYSDADWAGDATDRKSVTGFCIFLGDSLISWRSKKQTVVSCSSTEAEYRAMSSTTREIVWLRWLLGEMGVDLPKPTPMYCDNASAIHIARNSVFHERTKHIEVDCHITRHHYLHGAITLPFVTSAMQIADLFTKAHSVSRFHFLVDKLSMLSAGAS